MSALAVLREVLEAGAAACEALEHGDDQALAAALDRRDRLQRAAEPLLAALADAPRSPVEEVRELALLVRVADGVLSRGLAARRDAIAAELRQVGQSSEAVAAYAVPSPGGGRLRLVG